MGNLRNMDTTLKQTLEILSEANLIDTYADFSTDFADRNINWLSYTLHKGRDFNAETGINILRQIRKLKTFYFNKRQRVGAVVDDNIEALEQVDRLIQAHLENRYGILEIKQ